MVLEDSMSRVMVLLVRVFTEMGRRKRVIREGMAIFKLLSGKDEALLVRKNAGVNIEGDGVL